MTPARSCSGCLSVSSTRHRVLSRCSRPLARSKTVRPREDLASKRSVLGAQLFLETVLRKSSVPWKLLNLNGGHGSAESRLLRWLYGPETVSACRAACTVMMMSVCHECQQMMFELCCHQCFEGAAAAAAEVCRWLGPSVSARRSGQKAHPRPRARMGRRARRPLVESWTRFIPEGAC